MLWIVKKLKNGLMESKQRSTQQRRVRYHSAPLSWFSFRYRSDTVPPATTSGNRIFSLFRSRLPFHCISPTWHSFLFFRLENKWQRYRMNTWTKLTFYRSFSRPISWTHRLVLFSWITVFRPSLGHFFFFFFSPPVYSLHIDNDYLYQERLESEVF